MVIFIYGCYWAEKARFLRERESNFKYITTQPWRTETDQSARGICNHWSGK